MTPSLADLHSDDANRQNAAFQSLIAATREPVDWAYEIWDELLSVLKNGDNRQRAIAAQVLCNLAKSDPEQRMVAALGPLLETTRDERFVTARHCLQALWKAGVAGDAQRKKLIAGLIKRFRECASEKNCTLIRYDILESIRKVYDAGPDESLRTVAEQLIATETDSKYVKKYKTLWRK